MLLNIRCCLSNWFQIYSYPASHTPFATAMVLGCKRKQPACIKGGKTIRIPAPEIDLQKLQTDFVDYTKKVGTQKAMHLGVYKGMMVTSAVRGDGLVKLIPLINVFLKSCPALLFKPCDLKDTLANGALEVTGLYSPSPQAPLSKWAGEQSERLVCIFNHVRRIALSKIRFGQATRKMDNDSINALRELVGRVSGSAEAGLQVITLADLAEDDHAAIPMEDEEIAGKGEDLEMDDDDELMKQAMEAGPMPGDKRLMKRPAAAAKANHKDIMYQVTIAKAKSYICFTTVSDKAKKLLVGCSSKQSKQHGKVISTIHKFLLEQPLTKEQAVSLRNELIN